MAHWLKRLRLSVGRFVVRRGGGLSLAQINPAPTRFDPLKRFFKRMVVNEVPLQCALYGPIAFQVVRTAVEIGLIELLDERPGLAAATIAAELHVSEYAARVLLTGLASLEVVTKIGDEYHAHPFLSQMLLKRAVGGFGPQLLALAHHVVAPAITQLEASVRSGRPMGLKKLFGGEATSFYAELAQHGDLNAYFEPVMRQLSGANEDRVAAMPNWADCKRILDVGGGAGGLAMSLARHHRATTVTLFDFPSVAEAAAQSFRKTSESNRLVAVGGDLSREPLPAGHDCIVFSHFLDIFSEAGVMSYLGRAHDALPAGGKVCILTPVVDDDESGPLPNALLCSYFLCLANGEGRFYSAHQLVGFLEAAGFKGIVLTRLPMNEVALFAFKRSTG